ncbi:mechanosensitive ion channel family protein [Candidatus Saccharibacteria bacterium]|nr:mechanosensitive ion channel family protein [Candidatus Saccharibacteria bacterium]
MDFFNDIVNNIWVQRVFWSLVVIIISTIIYAIISKTLDKHEKRKTKLLANKKSRTMNRMIKSIVRYVLIILDALIILQIFGVDVSSMLAAAGVAGIIIAFAIKDALQDIIRGFDIVSDNYYNVGDIVKIGTVEGKVLAVGLKTTKIQDINTNNMVSIANRNIVEVEVMSDMIDIDVPLPYEISLDEAGKVMEEITAEIKKQANVTNSEYRKVSNFSASSMDYRIKVFGDPALRPQIRRDSLETIATVLAKHKISIPYPHLDLHTDR